MSYQVLIEFLTDCQLSDYCHYLRRHIFKICSYKTITAVYCLYKWCKGFVTLANVLEWLGAQCVPAVVHEMEPAVLVWSGEEMLVF